MKVQKKSKFALILILFSFLMLISVINLNEISLDENRNQVSSIDKNSKSIFYSQFNNNDKSLVITQNFPILEQAEDTGSFENINTVDLDLGSSRWNITDIELNFTDIKCEREIKNIESTIIEDHNVLMYKHHRAYAIQINLIYPTIIYGVEIYGIKEINNINPIYVQIQGFDSGSELPNSTIFGSMLLNMSDDTLGWHRHTFPYPINLPKGNFYLVINGLSFTSSEEGVLNFNINDETPNNPNLIRWRYYKDQGWDEKTLGAPLLYKLDQKINQEFFPNEINMSAEINGEDYSIENVIDKGTGELDISFNNFSPNTAYLNIPVKNNISITLTFNLSYYICLNHQLISSGTVKIIKDQNAIWTFEPIFNRFGYNYSIFYKYAKNWRYLTVLKGIENITSQVIISENNLQILNDTITQATSWKITANSTNVDPIINLGGKTSYVAGENFGISIESPAKLGNYTFILLDAIQDNVFSEDKEIINSNSFYFNYTFPSNSRNGEWSAFVFWNNVTAAGISIESFTVSGGIIITPSSPNNNGDDGNSKTINEGISTNILAIILILITVSVSGSAFSYITIKKVKKTAISRKQFLYDKFMDVFNLSYIMISHKKSGLNFFEKNFSGSNLNPSLISGYLSALNIFGEELTGNYKESKSIKLEYENIIILMSDVKNLRVIFVLKEEPSKNLIKIIKDLTFDIYNKYQETIDNFNGIKNNINHADKLLENYLNISLISPLKLKTINLKLLNQSEMLIVSRAKQVIKRNNLSYFFTSYLLPNQNFDYKFAKTIIDLIDKQVFIPLNVDSKEDFKKYSLKNKT